MSNFSNENQDYIDLQSVNLVPYETKQCNCIKNYFKDFTEIILYNEPFGVTTGNFGGIDEVTGEVFIKGLNVDRTRIFKEDNGVLSPIKDAYTIESVKRSIQNSYKRALDNIYGYTMSNDWDYFLTLTFDPNKVNRDNEEDIKYTFKLFRQKLQYINENVKIFAIPERHPRSGKLHLHVLVGDIDLTQWLTRAVNPHTGKPIKSHGRVVYNVDLFEYGFSTAVKCYGDPLKVANYLTKYVLKDFGTIGYNKKAYYHTHNLNFKNKELTYITDFSDKFMDLISTSNLCELYKQNDKITVYRIKLPFKEY